MSCETGAIYLVTCVKGKYSKDKTLTCGKHLGEIVRAAIEGALRNHVKVAYCPEPNTDPCEWSSK